MATLRDKLSVQVEERSQMESTIAQLKDKLHQTEVSHSATKGEVCSLLYSLCICIVIVMAMECCHMGLVTNHTFEDIIIINGVNSTH